MIRHILGALALATTLSFTATSASAEETPKKFSLAADSGIFMAFSQRLTRANHSRAPIIL